jgi:glutamate dehydrogenase/leucine dehydrogenase
MAWMADEYSKVKGYNDMGVVTGKPLNMGGSVGRNEATASGVMITIREAAKAIGMDLKEARVAVQGYGNAGSILASLAAEHGSKVVAVADSAGACITRRDGPQRTGWITKKRRVPSSVSPAARPFPPMNSLPSIAISWYRQPWKTKSPLKGPKPSKPK